MPRLAAHINLSSKTTLQLIHGDITEVKVDVIVNAANAQLLHGGGVAGAIVRKGGECIQAESRQWVRENGPIDAANPALTGAGRLPARAVIHAVGPIWGEGDEDHKLFGAVSSALAMANEQQFRSLALPAISTGIFGFPRERAAGIILEAVRAYVTSHPETSLESIQLVIFGQPTLNSFRAACEQSWPGCTEGT